MKTLKNGNFVLLFLWVLPLLTTLLGFLFGSPGTGLWDGLGIGISASVLVILVWAMVHISRPMRRLRAKVLAKDPASETQIVTLWSEETGHTKQALLVANGRGITIYTAKAEPVLLEWGDILGMRESPEVEGGPFLCEISARQDSEPLRFLPMTASGAREMKWWEFAPMLRRLRGAQHAAQNERAQ